jgi:hypothetical protein
MLPDDRPTYHAYRLLLLWSVSLPVMAAPPLATKWPAIGKSWRLGVIPMSWRPWSRTGDWQASGGMDTASDVAPARGWTSIGGQIADTHDTRKGRVRGPLGYRNGVSP